MLMLWSNLQTTTTKFVLACGDITYYRDLDCSSYNLMQWSVGSLTIQLIELIASPRVLYTYKAPLKSKVSIQTAKNKISNAYLYLFRRWISRLLNLRKKITI